ncbi:MAG: hypothetical protein HRF51_00890 [bacterium]|jgi:3-phosphoshikimate 1-carboxyvinyltransferase
MSFSIYPLKEIPEKLSFGGDYFATVAAYFVSAISEQGGTIQNRHKGTDADRVIKFLGDIGHHIEVNDASVKIDSPKFDRGRVPPECKCDTSFYPLSLAMGYLAGLEVKTNLVYSDDIDPIYLAYFIGQLAKAGLPLEQNPGKKSISFRPGKKLPVEMMIKSSYSYLKDTLFMFGAASGCSVAIRELIDSDNRFLKILAEAGAKITVKEAEHRTVPDDKDPRRKTRKLSADYKREIMLHPSTSILSPEFRIPSSREILPAVLTFAILRRKRAVLERVPISAASQRFLTYLKSLGAVSVLANKNRSADMMIADLVLEPGHLKGRKLAGEMAAMLIQELPFLAVIAASIPESTIIRNIGEANFVRSGYFKELTENLYRAGVKCGTLEDGLVIEGIKDFPGADYGPFKYPDIAASFFILSLAAQERSTITNFEIVAGSYPELVATFHASIKPDLPSAAPHHN